jgi:hypothetical protein
LCCVFGDEEKKARVDGIRRWLCAAEIRQQRCSDRRCYELTNSFIAQLTWFEEPRVADDGNEGKVASCEVTVSSAVVHRRPPSIHWQWQHVESGKWGLSSQARAKTFSINFNFILNFIFIFI